MPHMPGTYKTHTTPLVVHKALTGHGMITHTQGHGRAYHVDDHLAKLAFHLRVHAVHEVALRLSEDAEGGREVVRLVGLLVVAVDRPLVHRLNQEVVVESPMLKICRRAVTPRFWAFSCT